MLRTNAAVEGSGDCVVKHGCLQRLHRDIQRKLRLNAPRMEKKVALLEPVQGHPYRL